MVSHKRAGAPSAQAEGVTDLAVGSSDWLGKDVLALPTSSFCRADIFSLRTILVHRGRTTFVFSASLRSNSSASSASPAAITALLHDKLNSAVPAPPAEHALRFVSNSYFCHKTILPWTNQFPAKQESVMSAGERLKFRFSRQQQLIGCNSLKWKTAPNV